MHNAHAPCDLQDITRAKITQDIGVVAVIDTSGVLFAISSGHSDSGWVKRDVRADDLGALTITQVFHVDIVGAIERGIAFCANEKPSKARTYACDIFFSRRTYVSMLAQDDGKLVLEIEDFDRTLLAVNTIVDTANIIGKLTTNTGQVETINDLCEALFAHSAYDRVMTYKFLDDLSGEVIYELKDDSIVTSSFLGMRFPPGDIPLPARKAYVQNPVRFIADVEKPSCYLIQNDDHDVSLSRSFLRGCVAPHKSYLQAMEVRSSLSIAITNMDGNLWGLIAMHSYTKPMVPTIEDRVSYEILASVASNHVQYIENAESLAMESRVKAMVSQIDHKSSLGVFIVKNKDVLLDTFNIDSVSLFTPDGETTTVGENGAGLEDIPQDDVVEPLVCGQLDHPFRSFACLTVLGYKFVFTRACSYSPVKWAGNPKKLTLSEISPDMVMPRQSFEQYLDYRSNNPPPFTKQDRAVFVMTGDLMKTAIHHIKLARTERKVEQARKRSELVEMKSDQDYAFFSNMSHELRTPLHAISGVFDLMQHIDEDDAAGIERAIRRYSSIGLNTCKDMMKTLDDILAIVRKTHEKGKVDVSLVMVKEIFYSTSNGLEMFATKNGVGLCVTYDCEMNKLVRVDANKIIEIYNNIAGNAIKFSTRDVESTSSVVDVRIDILDSQKSVKQLWTTASGGFAGRLVATEDAQIEESEVLHKWLVFQTRDHGVGIHQDDMGKVFEKFSQIDDVATKKFSSTGLGLHITILNVRAMRGFLAVASTPGKGSLFVCALPVEDASSEPEKVADPTADPTQGFGNDPLNFVVVDDSKVNVMIAKKQIQRAFVNAKVHTAANGKLGVEQVERLIEKRVRVDGIFMDYHMPVMSGIDSSRAIRKKSIRAPITMLTADVTETSRQSMIASGIDLILLKPSKPHELVEMCVEMIRMAKTKN